MPGQQLQVVAAMLRGDPLSALYHSTIVLWPGISKWLIKAIGRRDYPAVQDGLLMSANVNSGSTCSSTCCTA